jgi:hypothetical protein
LTTQPLYVIISSQQLFYEQLVCLFLLSVSVRDESLQGVKAVHINPIVQEFCKVESLLRATPQSKPTLDFLSNGTEE